MSSEHIPARLRRLVTARARECCEYCLVPQAFALASHEVDHVVATKHGGATVLENLALSCFHCNRYKGSDLSSIDPESGEAALLFHPRRDHWREHFGLTGPLIVPLTSCGRATVRLLRLNQSERMVERAWMTGAGLLQPPH